MDQRQFQTNTPLFYAQRLMLIYEKDYDASIQQDQHALLTGAWLCLKESWGCWLNELSIYMNLERVEGYQLNELALLFKAESPEGQLLLGLTEDSESWLTTLLVKIAEPTERVKLPTKASAPSLGLISLVPTDEVEEDVLIMRVLSEFKEYIESVRARQVEW